MDSEERLKKIVKDTGEVNYVYGGFEINISKHTLFPWYKVFNQLIEIGQEVWVSKAEGKMSVISKPKV
jgi:hypothetical protein